MIDNLEFANSAEFDRDDAAAAASLRLDREWRPVRRPHCFHAATAAARHACGYCAAELAALNDTPPNGLPL